MSVSLIRTRLCESWYRAVPVSSGDSNCVDVVYVAVKGATVACETTIACGEDKDGPFPMATLDFTNVYE